MSQLFFACNATGVAFAGGAAVFSGAAALAGAEFGAGLTFASFGAGLVGFSGSAACGEVCGTGAGEADACAIGDGCTGWAAAWAVWVGAADWAGAAGGCGPCAVR